jgi:hypothetical protein
MQRERERERGGAGGRCKTKDFRSLPLFEAPVKSSTYVNHYAFVALKDTKRKYTGEGIPVHQSVLPQGC